MMRVILVLIIASGLMASCRSTRKIQTAIAPKDSVQAIVTPSKTPSEDSAAIVRQTVEKMQAGIINFTTFSAKINVDYQGTDGKKYDVNANLRMYKDSAIWISITAILGIEGLRAYITKDSVKLLNKQDKIYTARSVAYLQEVTALPLDLQSLHIISYSRSGNTISLLSAGDWFKNLLTLNENSRIENSKLDDVDANRSRTCNLSYTEYENKKGVLFSTKRRITVAEKSNLDIKLDFKNYDFNETLSFPFTIPKNYKRN
jgi:outer membrane biogenesis lipoprotein LolB